MSTFQYNHETHTIKGPHGSRVLTSRAHRLMECLLAHPDGILVEDLLDAVWPGCTKPATATIALRLYIMRLRRTIAETGAHVSLDNVQPGASLYVLRHKP